MKILGLIVEYNPFHNGHLYHIEESLRMTGCEKAIVVMSGDFVQRGTPAIMPKHLRTEMALKCGISLVIELPVRYATGSAEFFALGAISLLDSLKCVDYICFGSESGDIHALSSIADLLLKEPAEYKDLLQEQLKTGVSFPLARQRAVSAHLQLAGLDTNLGQLLEDPNNILGIEYIKALKVLHSPIIPMTILRRSSHYHDTDLQEDFSSATAIRNQLASSSEDNLLGQVPSHCYKIMKESLLVRYPLFPNDLSLLIHHKLMEHTSDSLLSYQDITPDLANRIINLRNQFISFDQFCDLVKTKNVTHSRISRALLHILLGIPRYEIIPESMNHYIRVLGFQKEDASILNLVKARSELPILTKLTQANHLAGEALTLLNEDLYSANLYEMLVTNKYNTSFIHEYEQRIIMNEPVHLSTGSENRV